MPRKRARKVKHIESKKVHIESKRKFRLNKKAVTAIALVGIFCIVMFFTSYFNYTSGVVINPEGSVMAHKMDIKKEGRYALRIR